MTLLSVENINFAYQSDRQVLDDVSFAVEDGVSVGLVGESGSGKSTILRILLGLNRTDAGKILFQGEILHPANRRFMRKYRRSVQPVFQDPYSSLDPRQRVHQIIAEPLRSLKIEGDYRALVEEALSSVGLSPDARWRYPHEFSGGQRQRIAIARAIVAGPRLLLADEAVSALDLSTRVRIVELLKSLSSRLTVLLVSHDLAVIAALCERIIVLEKGRVVEQGATRDVLASPQHPYTQRLLESVPRLVSALPA